MYEAYRLADDYSLHRLPRLVTEGGELTKAMLGVAGPGARRPDCG